MINRCLLVSVAYEELKIKKKEAIFFHGLRNFVNWGCFAPMSMLISIRGIAIIIVIVII